MALKTHSAYPSTPFMKTDLFLVAMTTQGARALQNQEIRLLWQCT